MDKLHKKMWIWIIMLILIVIMPLIINETYKVNKGYITLWSPEDVLSYYGSILAFISTSFLGYLSLLQNNRLNKINSELTRQQFKPIITISPSVDLSDEKEKQRTYYRIVEKNNNGVLINNGYSSKQSYFPYAILSIKNIGLGPAVNFGVFWYKLDSVKGLNSLDEILNKNIVDFYDVITYSAFDFEENNQIKKGPLQLFTEFDLGISDENNKLNLIFSFEENVTPFHSIVEINYENLLGAKFKKLVYLGYIETAYILPVSKEYLSGGI